MLRAACVCIHKQVIHYVWLDKLSGIILGCVTLYAFYNVSFSRLLDFGINSQVIHYSIVNLCAFILTLEFIRRFNNIKQQCGPLVQRYTFWYFFFIHLWYTM